MPAAAVLALLVGTTMSSVISAIAGTVVATAGRLVTIAVSLTLAVLLVQSILGARIEAVAVAHLVLLATALAAGGIGRVCRSWLTHRLDAIGTSVLVTMTLTLGPLLLGQLAGDLSPRMLNVALALNPVVAVAAAADIDLVRLPVFYDLSPIAHRAFSYPTLATSLGVHGGIVVIAFLAALRAPRAAVTATVVTT